MATPASARSPAWRRATAASARWRTYWPSSRTSRRPLSFGATCWSCRRGHLLAAPHAAVAPADYGRLLAFLSIFYEVVILDLGAGLTAPIARLALERADQRPGPTRSARCPVAFAFR
jgi:hypothetical protein